MAFFRRLAVQLSLLIIAAALPLAGVVAFLLHEYAGEEQEHGVSTVRTAARAVAADIDGMLGLSESLLDYLRRRSMVRELDPKRCDPQLTELLRLFPSHGAFIVVDREGRPVCPSSATGHAVASYADREWFRDAGDGLFGWGTPVTGRVSGLPVVTVTRPILDAGEEPAGVLIGSVSLAALSGFIGRPTLPSGSVVTVLDRQKRIVARSTEAERWIGHDWRAAEESRPFLRGDDDVRVGRGVDGEERLYAQDAVRRTGWRVSVGIPADVVLEGYRQNVRHAVLAVALAVMLGIGMAVALARRLMQPVRALERAALAASDGRFDARAEVAGPVEIASMAAQFNAMLAARSAIEAALKAHAEELAAANRDLEGFSQSVAHDLRTPLRALDGYSQALLEDYGDRLDAQAQDRLKRIRAAAQRLGELIDDILHLASLRAPELSVRAVDLTAIAQEVAGALRGQEPERQVAFDIQPGVACRGDERLLRLLMEHLLGNAWKFTSRRPVASIRFGVQRHPEGDAYYVADDGAGFDMAYVDKLFRPFERLHAVEDFPGNGVGLAAVKRIVTAHGGRVWAEGRVGRGATFYFTLAVREPGQGRSR